MCGTMSDVKRVTRKCVLEGKHIRGTWSDRGLYLCGYAMLASVPDATQCLQFGRLLLIIYL